jgi:hypothetical protein
MSDEEIKSNEEKGGKKIDEKGKKSHSLVISFLRSDTKQIHTAKTTKNLSL